jgi:hypothetical protein
MSSTDLAGLLQCLTHTLATATTSTMAKTPVVAKKSAKVAKAAAAPKKDGKKKRSAKRVESYNTYIYKVLKQVHPGKLPCPPAAARSIL